jgi:energy-coupling factor transporter ATP-binding protein EcfA2
VCCAYSGYCLWTPRVPCSQISLRSRVSLVGPNGCGKSTLLKLLMGELSPLTGADSFWCHHNLRVSFVPQHHADVFDAHAAVSPVQYLMETFKISTELKVLVLPVSNLSRDDVFLCYVYFLDCVGPCASWLVRSHWPSATAANRLSERRSKSSIIFCLRHVEPSSRDHHG